MHPYIYMYIYIHISVYTYMYMCNRPLPDVPTCLLFIVVGASLEMVTARGTSEESSVSVATTIRLPSYGKLERICVIIAMYCRLTKYVLSLPSFMLLALLTTSIETPLNFVQQ